MTIFKFGGSTAVGVPTVTEDHIFASEAERDAYFSPDRLDELVMGTPIIVNTGGRPRFQQWSAATPADAAAYDATNWTTVDEIVLNLQDNEIPVRMPGSNVLSGSGFTLDPMTGEISGDGDFRTSGTVEAGVATFRLGTAHAIRSAAENVTFRNLVTGAVFHPTWQTSVQDGDWSSVQRTPVGDLVEDEDFTTDRSQVVVNPNFEFTSLAFNNRLYAFAVEPETAVTNARLIVQQGGVDYWQSRPVDLTTGAMQNIAIDPFIDLFASTTYRAIVRSPDGDVRVMGSAAGIPRVQITYRQWADLPVATRAFVGDYRLDGMVEITGDVTITSANLETYNRKLWVVTSSSTSTVRISDNLDLTMFAVFVANNSGSILISAVLPSGVVRIDAESDKRYTARTGLIFVRTSANMYDPIGTNVGDAEDDFVQGASFAANVLTLDRNRLTDIMATMPVATQSAAGALSAADKTRLDGLAGTFIGLTDTPAALGDAFQFLRINAAGNAIVWQDGETALIGVDDSGVSRSATISRLNFNENLTVTAAGGTATINAAAGAGNLGNFRFDDTIEITGDVTVTAANRDTYNLKIWLITGGSHTVTINAGAGLTYFGVYVRVLSATGTLTPQASSNVRINNTTGNTVLDGRQSATYFSITTDRYQEVYNNFRPENFADLADTPAALGTAGQFPAVNAGGTALEFVDPPDAGGAALTIQDGGVQEGTDIATINFADNITVDVMGTVATVTGSVLGAASTNWDHAALPSGQIPSTNRRWYTYTGTGNVTRALPLESGITSGWHSFFGNDSTTATLFLTGDFRGSLNRIALLPQQGCEVSYNGSIFLEGPARNVITVSSFPDWTGNPLRPSTSYSGFSTNANGINLNNVGSRAALLNRNVRVVPTGSNDFQFDLEPLDSGNFGDVPIGSGFGVINQGVNEVVVRPASNDTLTRGGLTHNFSSGARLSPGAAITFVRSGQDTWNTTIQSGTITGGT